MHQYSILLLACSLLAIAISAIPADQQQTVNVPTILEDPLLHLGFAWKDISAWTDQATKDVKHELDKVDLGDTGEWLDQAGKDIGTWTEQAAIDVKKELDKIDLRDTGKWLDQAGKDIAAWTEQAVKDVKVETDKIDLTVPNEWIRGAATELKEAIANLNESEFEKWLKQASKDIGLDGALDDLQAVKLEELPTQAWTSIQEHLDQTAFYVVEGIVFIAPGIIYGPLLGLLGFGPHGIIAGSAAALLQPMFGGLVPAAGWFAHLTSASMGGYGVGLMNGLLRAGGVVAGAVKIGVDRAEDFGAGSEPERKEL